MRTTGLVLGIVGGIFGILFGLLAMAVGGTSNALEEGTGDMTVWLGVSAIAAAIAGIVFSGLGFGGQRAGPMAVLVAVTAVWHVISISYFGILGGILLLLAALFLFLGRRRATEPVGA